MVRASLLRNYIEMVKSVAAGQLSKLKPMFETLDRSIATL